MYSVSNCLPDVAQCDCVTLCHTMALTGPLTVTAFSWLSLFWVLACLQLLYIGVMKQFLCCLLALFKAG